MGKVITGAVVFLDGSIANDQDEVGALFDWYGNGEVAWRYLTARMIPAALRPRRTS